MWYIVSFLIGYAVAILTFAWLALSRPVPDSYETHWEDMDEE